MAQQKNKVHIINILCYVLFLFMFACLGFMNKSISVKAEDKGPVIIIPNDYKLDDGDLKVYVGYNENNFNYIKYGFSSDKINKSIDVNDWTEKYSNGLSKAQICDLYNKNGTCPSKLREFSIPSSEILNVLVPNEDYNGKNTGVVVLYMEADNEKKALFIYIGGGKTNANRNLVLDNEAPFVNYITVSIKDDTSGRDILKIGDTIKFDLSFNENLFNKNTKLEFNIGENVKTASCSNNINNIKSHIICEYQILEGDNGDISFKRLVSNSMIKDRYNNVLSGYQDLSKVNVSKSYKVDGIKPFIERIEVIKNVYSVSKDIVARVIFNEAVKSTKKDDLPVLSFGDYAACYYSESTDISLIYICRIRSAEKSGYLTTAKINYEKSYIYDLNDNKLVDIVDKDYELTVVDESGNVLDDKGIHINSNDPELDFNNFSYKITRDGKEINEKFVKKDDGIIITVPIRDGVDVASADVNAIKVTFGEKVASPAISFAGLKLIIDITVLQSYNGKLNVTFDNFTIVGENGLNKVINTNLDLKIYADNESPVISNAAINASNGKNIDNVIYGGDNTKITFEFVVNDISDLSFDTSKLYIKSGSRVVTFDSNDISIDGNKVSAVISIDKLIGLDKFSFVVEKEFAKDIFERTFVNELVSEVSVDLKAPVIDMNFEYPKYKGVSLNDKNYLVSGNDINIELFSSDKDLKAYCLSSTENVCDDWENIEGDSKFTYSFKNDLDNGYYNVYLCIVDYGDNKTCVNKTLEINRAFEYKTDMVVRKSHSVGVNAFMFNDGSIFYYKWIKEGSSVSNFTNTTIKNSSLFMVESDANLNGKYMLCIKQNDNIVCSDYLEFDNDIDEFSVDFSINLNSDYVKDIIGTTITFNDISTIKCVAVGKNVSDVSCERGKNNVTYYAGSDFGSPISAYSIVENGEYTFYIEDVIGNSKKLTYVINNIDREKVSIDIYNEKGSTNLENEIYKNTHTFKVMFDENITSSRHVKYSYFFSTRKYITDESNSIGVFYSEDNFNNYFYSSDTKLSRNVIESSILNSKQLLISSPNSSGIYNLYIRAIDIAGNVSYAYLENICVDADAPVIVMKDEKGNITNGNSDAYIANFQYIIEINDILSSLNKDEIYYEFVEANTNRSVYKAQYKNCELGSKSCVIENIELDASKFSADVAYKFYVYAFDNAGNKATYSTNKLYIKVPTISINTSFDQNKYTNARSLNFTISRNNEDANIERVAYCLNECSYENKMLSSGFINLEIKETNSYVIDNIPFVEGVNSLYLYAIDEFGNYKLEVITVKYDSISPIVNMDYISPYTANSSNLYVTLENGQKVYNYSNELQIKIKFAANSLLDLSSGSNNNLRLNVCFEKSCNLYTFSGYIKDGYYVNRELSVSSPVNFSGKVTYYLIDDASNRSEEYSFKVVYSLSVNEINATITDSSNSSINENKKYTKVLLNVSNSNADYLIEKQYIKYALVSKNINLLEEKENYSGTITDFLNLYGFVTASANHEIITKNNVDDSYYVWVYIRNEIGNYTIKKIETLVNIDTIAPDFESTIIDVKKNSDDTYSLVMHNELEKEELYININGTYELVDFIENNNEYIYTFNKNNLSLIFTLKLVDEAGNETTRNYEYSSIKNSVFAKAYFNAKNKNVKVTVNNLGSKKVTKFIYVIDDINSTSSYDINNINYCNEVIDEVCKSEVYSVSNNIYSISISEDKKLTFFIYVDGVLIEELLEVVTRFDDEKPVIAYSLKNSSGGYGSTYTVINEDVLYVQGAIKVKMTDNKQLNYFEVYNSSNTLVSTCYFDVNEDDYNCNRESIEKSGNTLFYRLETGNYTLKVYDMTQNVREVKIITDTTSPVINLYKKINNNYYYQNVIANIYGSLEGLYVSVDEENFKNVDVVISNGTNKTSLTYSYASEIGKCLVNRDGSCEYGVSVLELINNNSSEYNQITIKVYDKANRETEMVIRYDDKIPNIYLDDTDGSVIYLGNSSYTISDESISIEIGKDELTIRDLLIAMKLNINGRSYDSLINDSRFNVAVYKNNSLYEENMFANIGNYVIKINFTTESGNKAEEKQFKVNIVDTLAPTVTVVDNINNVELNEDVEIIGVRAIDNYAIEIIDGNIVKEKIYGLDSAICEGSYCSNVKKTGSNKYVFSKAGTYKFTYTISDASNNKSTIEQVIVVSDNKAPIIESAYDESSFVLEISERDSLGQVVSPMITLRKPTSYDIGDGKDNLISPVFEGVYVANNIGTKAKSNEEHLVLEDAMGLKFKFTKVGTYYIRFISMDSTNHISVFEYEVNVVDNISPVIKGISEYQVIELDLDSNFDVMKDIIEKYNVVAEDNYYSNVSVMYEIKNNDTYDYEVTLIARDLSLNETRVTIYVRFIDTTKPVAGTLVLPNKTNLNSILIEIVGGEDNSNNWWHEYNVQNGDWLRYNDTSKVEFGNGFVGEVRVCIRAVDYYNNISDNTDCKTIYVDTTKPVINGVESGEVVDKEVEISVSDNSLDYVKIWLDNEEIEVEDIPFKLNKNGAYRIETVDTFGNKTVVDFVINANTYVNVVNDIKNEEYTTTSVTFDKRLLVKVDIEYDLNGYINVTTDLSNISIGSKDIAYVLGLVPNTNDVFVLYSVNGDDIISSNKVTLISNGEKFINGAKSTDYFLNFNDSYYAYVIVKKDVNEPVITEKESKEKEKGGALSVVLIAVGSLATLFLGYQIVRLRRRVRAA